jgi:DNA-binding response OmpR family regulator
MGEAGMPGVATVLVVEDEALISEMVADVLLDRGFEVHVVSNANDALRYLVSDRAIDLLFTDINLAGDMDGATLAVRARELRPNIPVVFASARVSLFGHLSKMPAAACLPKPYDTEQLCSTVEGMFATRH